jgi:hypothetical protein
MTIRETLQIEIWSKETSRKILAKTLKVLARLGIVIGVLAVAIGIVLTAEMRWMTPAEGRIAREALSSLDALQDFGALNGGDFNAGLVQARAKVQLAQDSAWTLRDSGVASLLFEYWNETRESRKEKQMLEAALLKFPQSTRNLDKWHDPNQAGAELRGVIRSALHKDLD